MASRSFLVTLAATVALFGVAALPAAAQNLATQQSENKKWEDAAKKLEADLLAEGQRQQTAKDFAKAADFYRRALGVTYEQWDIQESRGVTGTVTYYPSLKKIRKRLDTSNTKTVRDKLAGLDAAIQAENESAFKKNATDWTAEARDAAKDKKPEGYAEAYGLYERIAATGGRLPQTKPVTQEVTKAQAEMKKIVDLAEPALAEPEKLVKEGKIGDGLVKLAEFGQTWRYVAEAHPDFRKRVAALRANPDVRKYLREQDAIKRMETGDASLARGDYVGAIRQYRGVVVSYADLDVAQKAVEKLGEIVADPKAVDDLKELDVETRCRVTLSRIESLVRLKKFGEARPQCVKLIADSPDTPWSARAQEILETIKRETGQ